MLKQIGIGFRYMRFRGIRKPGPQAWIIIAFFRARFSEPELIIIIFKSPLALIPLAANGYHHPAVLKAGFQLAPDVWDIVKVDDLKEVAVFKTNVDGIEHIVVLHYFGKERQYARGDPVTIGEGRVVGQHLRGLKCTGIDTF